jgi:hypothetical protein
MAEDHVAAETTEAERHDTEERFSLVAGGPFNALLGHAGLLAENQLPSAAAALCLALLAWLVPAMLAVAQSIADQAYRGGLYFQDLSTLARYFIAVAAMLLSEHRADARTLHIVNEFRRGQLLSAASRAEFRRRVATADYWSTAPLVEAALLVTAWFASAKAMSVTISLEGVGWEEMAQGGSPMSWAGLAAQHFSGTLFFFLVLRWLWRLGIWSMLLFRISRLPLQLRALHPDRCGGLGFLSLYPGVFRGFVFALSCVLATLLLKDLEMGSDKIEVTMDLVRGVIAAWALVVAVLFLAPLLVFYEPLFELREEALRLYGNRSMDWLEHHEGSWGINRESNGPQQSSNVVTPAIGEIENAFAIINSLRAVPLDRTTVIHLYFAALAPLIVVAASRIPIRELLARVAGVLI